MTKKVAGVSEIRYVDKDDITRRGCYSSSTHKDENRVETRKRGRGARERVGKEEKEQIVKERAAVKWRKREGKEAYKMGVGEDQFKWTDEILKQAHIWGDTLPVTKVRTKEFFGAYVNPKRAMMFMLQILQKKGMLELWHPGESSWNVWFDNRGMDVDGDASVDGVDIDRHTSKGTHIRVHNEVVALVPLDASLKIVQQDLMTFPIFNVFVAENSANLKRIIDALGLDKIRTVAGMLIVYYCCVDKHAIETLLQFHGDFLTLDDHPAQSLIKYVPWMNVIWDPDHHGPCVFGWLLDTIYTCAVNPGRFVAEVRQHHKLLKKWDVGDRILWSKVKVVIGWAEKSTFKAMAKLKLTIKKTCKPEMVDPCTEMVDCFLKMTYALIRQEPTQAELDNIRSWGVTMESKFSEVSSNGEVPNAVLIWCRKQPLWLNHHRSLYRLRTEGRERTNQRDQKSVDHSTQFVENVVTQSTADVSIVRNVVQEWNMYREDVHNPFKKLKKQNWYILLT